MWVDMPSLKKWLSERRKKAHPFTQAEMGQLIGLIAHLIHLYKTIERIDNLIQDEQIFIAKGD